VKYKLKPYAETQQGIEPVRQRLATSRNRVLRGSEVTHVIDPEEHEMLRVDDERTVTTR
jgi:hypothetical protein